MASADLLQLRADLREALSLFKTSNGTDSFVRSMSMCIDYF